MRNTEKQVNVQRNSRSRHVKIGRRRSRVLARGPMTQRTSHRTQTCTNVSKPATLHPAPFTASLHSHITHNLITYPYSTLPVPPHLLAPGQIRGSKSHAAQEDPSRLQPARSSPEVEDSRQEEKGERCYRCLRQTIKLAEQCRWKFGGIKASQAR